jgi:hypothetical protein
VRRLIGDAAQVRSDVRIRCRIGVLLQLGGPPLVRGSVCACLEIGVCFEQIPVVADVCDCFTGLAAVAGGQSPELEVRAPSRTRIEAERANSISIPFSRTGRVTRPAGDGRKPTI